MTSSGAGNRRHHHGRGDVTTDVVRTSSYNSRTSHTAPDVVDNASMTHPTSRAKLLSIGATSAMKNRVHQHQHPIRNTAQRIDGDHDSDLEYHRTAQHRQEEYRTEDDSISADSSFSSYVTKSVNERPLLTHGSGSTVLDGGAQRRQRQMNIESKGRPANRRQALISAMGIGNSRRRRRPREPMNAADVSEGVSPAPSIASTVAATPNFAIDEEVVNNAIPRATLSSQFLSNGEHAKAHESKAATRAAVEAGEAAETRRRLAEVKRLTPTSTGAEKPNDVAAPNIDTAKSISGVTAPAANAMTAPKTNQTESTMTIRKTESSPTNDVRQDPIVDPKEQVRQNWEDRERRHNATVDAMLSKIHIGDQSIQESGATLQDSAPFHHLLYPQQHRHHDTGSNAAVTTATIPKMKDIYDVMHYEQQPKQTRYQYHRPQHDNSDAAAAEAPTMPPLYREYPVSAALVVLLHVLFVRQWYARARWRQYHQRVAAIAHRNDEENHDNSTNDVHARISSRMKRRLSYTSIAYEKLVQKKQFFRIWLPLLSHPLMIMPKPTVSSSSTSNTAPGNGTSTNATNTTATPARGSASQRTIPMGNSETAATGNDDVETYATRLRNRRYYSSYAWAASSSSSYYNTLQEYCNNWSRALNRVKSWSVEFYERLVAQHKQDMFSLVLLVYNSHLIWSCRALERHYADRSHTIDDSRAVVAVGSQSDPFAYVRVLAALAMSAVLIETFVTHRLGRVARGLRLALTATSGISEETQTALRQQGYNEVALQRLYTTLYRQRSIANVTVIPCAIISIFDHVFPRVPLQILPFVANPPWFVDPGIAFLIIVAIETFLLYKACKIKQVNVDSNSSTSSSNAARTRNRAAATTNGTTNNASTTNGTTATTNGASNNDNTASNSNERNDDASSNATVSGADPLSFIHVIAGILAGALWTLGLEFFASAYWGNGLLVLLGLMSMASAKASSSSNNKRRRWSRFLVCVDYVGCDRRGRILVPGVDEPIQWKILDDGIGGLSAFNNFGIRGMGGDTDDDGDDSSRTSDGDDDEDDYNALIMLEDSYLTQNPRDRDSNDSIDEEVQRAFPRQDDEEIYGLLPNMTDMLSDEFEEIELSSTHRRPSVGAASRSNVRSRRGGGAGGT